VIARNTAFTFKGKNIDAKEIGKELGVRYVLEGSVQRDQNRVRVNAQLIDAETGAHLWADRFEEDIADLFKLQDQVVARLANALGNQLVKAEAARSAHSKNPDSFDLTMQAWEIVNTQLFKKTTFADAEKLFAEALKLDSSNPDAIVGEAYINVRAHIYGWVPGPLVDAAASAVDQLTKAIETSPDYAPAHYYKSYALFLMNHYPEALASAQEGARLNPNLALAYFGMGQAEWPLGKCEQAITHVNQALDLSPRDPAVGLWHFNIGNADFCLKRYAAAITEYKYAIDLGFRVPPWGSVNPPPLGGPG
jgi:tetratricopeptide (TPR) repeat protein